MFDHLDGEAQEEVKYQPCLEQGDPKKMITILQELYGCIALYVALQEAFFSRRQQEEETLLEFSLALLRLMDQAYGNIKKQAYGNKGLPVKGCSV